LSEYMVEKPDTNAARLSPPPRLPQDIDKIATSYYNLRLKLSKSEQELDVIRKGKTTPE